jgi:hypothetical protein
MEFINKGFKNFLAFVFIRKGSNSFQYHWVDESVELFAFVMPMPVKAFTSDRLDEAKAWFNQ